MDLDRLEADLDRLEAEVAGYFSHHNMAESADAKWSYKAKLTVW